MNSSYDFNVLKAGILQSGHEIVSSPEEADEIVYSGCSVRSIWVDDAVNQINEAAKRSPEAKLRVTGCLANTSANTVINKSTTENLSIESMPDILKQFTDIEFSSVDRSYTQNSKIEFESDSSEGLENLRRRVGKDKAEIVAELQEIDRRYGTKLEHRYRKMTKGFVFYDEIEPSEMITVTRSCPYKCAFCNIPQGRGKFESTPIDSVVEKVKFAVQEGKYHIVLIGDEIGNYYDFETKTNFSDMVEAVLEIHKDLKLSIRYIEPKPFLKFYDKLLKWSCEGKIQLLYISIQSGSQRILKMMNRGYNLTRLCRALNELRDASGVLFYGNWLLGFPSETDRDFDETVAIVKELNFHINVVIPFSARENTPAFEMQEQIDDKVIDQRVSYLTEVVSDMKASRIEQELSFLDTQTKKSILSKIKHAESLQYADDQKKSEPDRNNSLSIKIKQL